MGEEPAVLASCLSFARWDSTGWSGGLPGPMKAVVIRNTILILDSGCKEPCSPLNGKRFNHCELSGGGDDAVEPKACTGQQVAVFV